VNKSVSFIIIAHQNSFTLKDTLLSCEHSARDHDQLILVLNNPSHEVIQIAANLSERWQIVHESKPGPQHARNCGHSYAKHEYLVFLDDDVKIYPGWIEKMLPQFSSPWVAAGQGAIEFEKNSSLYWNYLRFCHLSNLKAPALVVDTAALVMKKSWFVALGGFDPDLSMCEDTDLGLRIKLHGGEIFCEKKILLTQLYNPHESFYKLCLKVFRAGKFIVILRKKNYLPKAGYFEGFHQNRKRLKPLYLKNPVFFVLDLIKALVTELGMTPFQHELGNYPKKGVVSHNRSKLDV
jgi:glycosyltransferase involved in cell wall biosynthesis